MGLNAEMKIFSYAVLALWIGWALIVESASRQQDPIAAPASRQLEDKGFEHFYSLEYDQAIATFQKLRDAEPNNSNWQNHLASAYIYKQLHLAGVLQGDMFTSSNKFFRTKKIQVDPALEKTFWEANGAAIRICEQRLKRNRKDEDALYACGVAYATLATHQALIDRSKLSTLSTARKASIYHTELTRLNPRCYDAYLVPGIYDFVLGSLPASMKFFLLFGGFSGDKERGMRAAETAARQGDHAKQDAKILLAVMYRREKRYADAERTLSELEASFPRNYIFPLEIASIYRSAGEDKEAIRQYEQVLSEILHGRTGYAEAPAARIHYELGGLYWKKGDLKAAMAHLEQVPGSLGSTPELEQDSTEIRRQIETALQQRQPG